MRFAIVIHKDAASSYGVTVPDLPGCSSGDETLEGSFIAARDAILLHLEGMLTDGEELPHTKTIEEHVLNDDYRDGVWGFVDVDLESMPDKTVRIDVTIPSRVLAAINEWVKRNGETRSGFLTKAARKYIEANSTE